MKWLIILAEVPDTHPLALDPLSQINLHNELVVFGPPEIRGQQVIYHQKWADADPLDRGVPPSG